MKDNVWQSIGGQLGTDAFEREKQVTEVLCQREKERINAANEPEIVFLRAQLLIANERRKELLQERGGCSGNAGAGGRRETAWYLFVTTSLTIAGFVFAIFAFEPFRFGAKGFVYALALAIVGPFSIDVVLEQWQARAIIMRALSVLTVATILPAIILLGVVRGDILTEPLRSSTALAVLDDEQPQATNIAFVARITMELQLALLLAAVAMEVAAGLALHKLRRMPNRDEEHKLSRIRSELEAVERQMAETLRRIRELEMQAPVFEATLWRDFFHGFFASAGRAAGTKLLGPLAIVVVLISSAFASEPVRRDLLFGDDLSLTEATIGSDGKTEADKNATAIGLALREVPAGCRVRILPIEADGLDTYLLLSAHVIAEPGYFGERLAAARQQLAVAWRKRASHLAPSAGQTDVFGTLAYMASIRESGAATTIMLFSDMRNEMPQLNLQTPGQIDVPKMLAKVERQHLFSPLAGVDIHVFGVNASGRDMAYWNSLKDFWSHYFARCGASLRTFSLARDRDQIARVVAGR